MAGDSGSFIDWKKSYETGIKQIDDEHKYLCSIINVLYDAIISEGADNNEAFNKALKEVVFYLRCHFKNEEAIMAKMNYPLIEEHKNMHKKLTAGVIENANKYYSGQPFVANNFVRLLRDWLLEHIALEDLKMGKTIIKILIKQRENSKNQ